MSSSRVRAFDGLRGLAVAAVLLFHAEVAGAHGGFLGVSAFFTLSGFLITSLLLSEHTRDGRIDLRRFWARRARRLLPAATIALGGVLAYAAFAADASQIRQLRGDMFSALAYVANWHFIIEGRSYGALFAQPSPLAHFWSLAIEEQFYIVFPLFLVGIWKLARGRMSILAGVLAVAAFGSITLSIAGAHDLDRVYYGTDTRAAELLVGALLAILFARWAGPRTRAGRHVLGVTGFAALALMLFWWATVARQDAWLYHGGFAVHATTVAVVIGAAGAPTLVARILGLGPLAALGRISYGVYLFHWPVFLWLSPARVSLSPGALFALRVAVTLACATFSFLVIEEPIRTARVVRGMWPRVLAPVAASLLVVGAIAATASPPPAPFTLRPVTDAPSVDRTASSLPARVARTLSARLPQPAATRRVAAAPAPPPPPLSFHRPLAEDRPVRVLVVGDSVGITLGRGLELWSNDTGRAVVANEAKEWCSLGRDLPRMSGFETHVPGEGCNAWDRHWTKFRDRFDPDAVVVLFTLWEIVARQLPGADFSEPGNPAHDRWQLGEYEAAADVLGANGANVIWLTLPCTPDTAAAARAATRAVNENVIGGVKRSRNFVRVLDLDAELCPRGEFQPDYAGVDPARPDGLHFSDEGARAVANWMMPIVLGDAPPPIPVSVRRPLQQ